MANLETQLQQILDKKNLLNHPFYQAWSNGTLPAEKLKLYAKEYGTFIQMIQKGWEACGEEEIGQVEAEHFDLWQDFSASLGNGGVQASIEEVKALTDACNKQFSGYASALGALYAFEAQQPKTAASKLDGLREHYTNIQADETYFKVHVHDDEEPALILKKMESLPAEDQQAAVTACEDVADKLWGALTGIMDAA